jgi:hypothetical protein
LCDLRGNGRLDGQAANKRVYFSADNSHIYDGAGDSHLRFDFGDGHDVIDFSATDMTLAALLANAVDTAAGVLLQVGSGSILLAGLALHQIEWSSDFIFAA